MEIIASSAGTAQALPIPREQIALHLIKNHDAPVQDMLAPPRSADSPRSTIVLELNPTPRQRETNTETQASIRLALHRLMTEPVIGRERGKSAMRQIRKAAARLLAGELTMRRLNDFLRTVAVEAEQLAPYGEPD